MNTGTAAWPEEEGAGACLHLFMHPHLLLELLAIFESVGLRVVVGLQKW